VTSRPGPVAVLGRLAGTLALAGAGLLAGAVAHPTPAQAADLPGAFPVAASDTTSTTATTATTTPAGAPPYQVSLVPCGATSGPCRDTPEQVQVRYPAGLAPQALELEWSPGSNASAPAPAATSVTLCPGSSGCASGSGSGGSSSGGSSGSGSGSGSGPPSTPCDSSGAGSGGTSGGTATLCWSWPTQLEDAGFILNGTYDAVVCATYGPTGQDTSGCTSQLPPQTLSLAVPPEPPASVNATVDGAVVTVSWTAPADPPPDLAGYQVSRNGAPFYTCSLGELDPAASGSCPTALSVTDRPPDGEYTYSVAALRLGATDAASDLVASVATEDSAGVLVVPAATTGPSTTTTTPITSSSPPTSASSGPAATAAPGTSAGNGAGTTSAALTGPPAPGASSSAPVAVPAQPSASVPPLSYPPVAASKDPAPLVVRTAGSTGRTDVVPAAVLALGLLSLAVAAHFLYLRVELGVVQARLTGRRLG
jgi:hypothetical protein